MLRRKRNADSNVGFADESGRRSGAVIGSGYNHNQTLALPKDVEHWSLTTLREKLVKIGAKVAIPLPLFAEILRLIAGLRPRTAPT